MTKQITVKYIEQKQKEGLQAPLTKQITVKYIEQELENDITPRHISKPTVTEIKIT